MPEPGPVPGIACSGCGRAYDAGLLARGRTFRCTCGERVGRRLVTGILEGDREPRFLADVMLGKLARWLRALGYDCAWEAEIRDEALVRRGIDEHRVVLTRDRGLAADWWVEGIVLVRSDHPLEQLREVASAVELTRRGLFTRCTHCNEALEPATPTEVRDRVPADIRDQQTEFSTCPSCRRIYWKGSHVQRMQNALDTALSAESG